MNQVFVSPDSILDKMLSLESIRESLASRELGMVANFDELYPRQCFPEIADKIRRERAAIYYEAIEQQANLQESGIERVKTLRGIFDFYANHVLGGKVDAAIADVYQQETDVSTMTSFSHSFLLHAGRTEGENSTSELAHAKEVVDYQFTLLKDFQRISKPENTRILGEAKQLRSLTPLEIFGCSQRFERTTMEVANQNVDLARTNLRLFDNIAHGLYFWIKSMKDNQSPALGDMLFPLEDLQYENDLLGLSLQRVGVYAQRAQYLYRLANEVSSEDDSEEIKLLGGEGFDNHGLYLSPPNHL